MEYLSLTSAASAPMPPVFNFIVDADQKIGAIANSSMGLSSIDYDHMREELVSRRQKPLAWAQGSDLQTDAWSGSWHVARQVALRALNKERNSRERAKYGCLLVPVSAYLLFATPIILGPFGLSVTDLFFYSIPARLYYSNLSKEKLLCLARRRAVRTILLELEINLSHYLYKTVETKGTKEARSYTVIDPIALSAKDEVIHQVNQLLENLINPRGAFWEIGQELNMTSSEIKGIKSHLKNLEMGKKFCKKASHL